MRVFVAQHFVGFNIHSIGAILIAGQSGSIVVHRLGFIITGRTIIYGACF